MLCIKFKEGVILFFEVKNNRGLWLGLFVVLFYSLFSWDLPITDPVESNYTLTAKEMLTNGSYFSPIIYGNPWFDKPILTYWMLMLSYKLFGISDFTSRLPGIIASGLSVMLLYNMVKTITKSIKAATFSAFFLATSFEFWYIGHAVVTDMWLFLFTIGTFFHAYLSFERHSRKHIILAYAYAGMAVITKGPIGLVLPGLLLLAYLLGTKQWKLFKLLFSWQGILVFLAISMPWYVYMYLQHGSDFINGFLGLHNYVRATISEHPKQNVWYFYLVLLPVSLLPWLGFTLYEVKHLKLKNSFTLYSLIWGLGIILFYSLIATKYITYTFPAHFIFIIFTGLGAEHLVEKIEAKEVKLSKAILVALVPLLAFTTLLAIATTYSTLVNANYLLLYGAILLVGTLLFVIKKQLQFTLNYAIAASIPLYIAIILTIPPLLEEASGYAWSKEIPPTTEQVYIYGNYRTSIPYYSNTVVTQIIDEPDPADDIWSIGKAVMPRIIAEDLVASFDASTDALILVPKNQMQHFSKTHLSSHVTLIKENNSLYIFKNENM